MKSENATTVFLILGHLLFKGLFSPVLVWFFAVELREQLARAETANGSGAKLSQKTRFVTNWAPFLPCVLAVAIAGALFAFPNLKTQMQFPIVSIGIPRYPIQSNLIVAGYLAYLMAMMLAILLRKDIAEAGANWVLVKLGRTETNYGFSNRKALFWCALVFLIADFFVGYLAQLFPYTPSSESRLLFFSMLALPAGALSILWTSAFFLSRTDNFRGKQ
jgi:hypothetical protein